MTLMSGRQTNYLSTLEIVLLLLLLLLFVVVVVCLFVFFFETGEGTRVGWVHDICTLQQLMHALQATCISHVTSRPPITAYSKISQFRKTRNVLTFENAL